MKLTHTQNMKASKSGMTLLELTVVILVLLSLISILFVGARAWKKGSDRAANILNIRNVQQAVRGYMNIQEIPTPDTTGGGVELLKGAILGTGGDAYLKEPVAPASDLTYTYTETAPAIGELYLDVTDATVGDDYSPKAGLTDDW